MEQTLKWKEWVNEHVPMLARVYDNKYVGMLYDRFASLPPKSQKRYIWGVFGGFTAIVMGYLLWSYLDLWSLNSRTKESYSMANMLIQYQKQRRDKSQNISTLSRNAQLSSPGALKQHLLDLGRSASISPRMMAAQEGGNQGSEADVKMTSATVTLNRVTLTQVTNFLKSLENGQYDLSVSSIRVTNDDKIRGYMKVELGVVAYLFETDEG